MEHIYLPIKVLDKEYADKLMQGEIFMRPLGEFGSWRISENSNLGGEVLNNDFRGDIGEGIVRNLAPDEDHPVFDGFPQELQKAMVCRYFIDDAEKETRLFCMAKLEYDVEKQCYRNIDERFSEFGDTAVIILDPEAFYQRICACYQRMFTNNFIVEVGEIEYKSIFCDYGEWGLYVKDKKYEWQQEVRIAARLRPDIQVLENRQKASPVKAQIGDLSGIAIEVPLKDLLDGIWPSQIMDSHLLMRISQCHTPEVGITDYSLLFTGKFEEVGPYEEWITYWKEKLHLDDWTTVTVMEKLKNDKMPVPRLAFIQNNGNGRLFFHYQAVEFHQNLGKDKDFQLANQLCNVLYEKFAGKYVPTGCALVMNLGEVNKKYDDKLGITDRFMREENNQQIIYGLEKSQLGFRNVFGLSCFDLRWRAVVECRNQYNVDGRLFLQENIDRAQKTIQILSEGSDVYEQFHKDL